MNVIYYTLVLVERIEELTSWDLIVLSIYDLTPHTHTHMDMEKKTSKRFYEILIR